MAISYAQRSDLACPTCGAALSVDVWMIVDAAERPDLLEHILQGTLHQVICPNGHAGMLDAPLLLYRPGATPPLLFLPAEQTSPEQDQEQAKAMIGLLRDRLGAEWRDDLIEGGLQGVSRARLPDALRGEDERAAPPAGSVLLALLQQFIGAETWSASQAVVEAHPELLSDEADALLEQLVGATQAESDVKGAQIFAEHRDLLRRCREVGVDRAFREKMGPGQEGPPIPPPFREDLREAQEQEARYLQTGDLAALDGAVAAWERILSHPSFSAADMAFRLAALNDGGGAFLQRYEARGQYADLERAIALYGGAVAGTPVGSPDRAGRLNNLGNGLRDRFARTGEPGDLERAIAAYEGAVAEKPTDPLQQTVILNNLGGGLSGRYARTGDLADLERAIASYEGALAGTAAGSPNRATYLSNLGGGLRDRYARTGDLADLERAIASLEAAVEGTPMGSPDRAGRLNNLSLGLRNRYARTGDLGDLERAITSWEEAVEETPMGSPDRAAYLNGVGLGLSDRYARTGELGDLERAITSWEGAVAGTLASSPDRAMYLNSLGAGLRERYARTGELGDLERGIAAHEEAAAGTPVGSPERTMYLDNLGNGLSGRYARTGDLGDLERAIASYEGAAAETPGGSPDRAGRLNNLGAGLRDRYARTGDLADLERAIASWEGAVAGTPVDSADRAIYLNNLGAGLRDRYARTGDLADLERAIASWEGAVAGTPVGSFDRAGRLNNLGIGLRDRYAHTGEPGDLDQAITFWAEAIAGMPVGSPERTGYLNNLGAGLHERYARTGELGDLERGVACYEEVWTLLQESLIVSPVAYKLGQQGRWAGLYSRLVDSQVMMAEVDQDAPAARRRALVVAEGTKSRLLTEGLGRLELPAPSSADADLVGREATLLAELAALDTTEFIGRGRGIDDGPGRDRHAAVQRRQELVTQLGETWRTMAASGPEAEDYVALRRGDPPAWENLVELADELGPQSALASLFTTAERTLLFLLRAGQTEPIILSTGQVASAQPGATRGPSRDARRRDASRHGELVDESSLALIAQALPHLGGVRRLVFAPEGQGHLIPWAVVLRWLGWSGSLVTLPALGLLPRLRRRPPQRAGGALVVGNPQLAPEFQSWLREHLGVEALPPLPYAEIEARRVGEMLRVTPLIGPQATKQAVLERLAEPAVVHLACHAYFSPDSPLDSGLLLADGLLTAREVIERRLQADLLVLSACQTGRAGSLGGEELAGLAQAFLYAGAQSLLVSLWSVNDLSTAALMTAFYQARQEGVAKDVALVRAMDDVQAQQPDPFYWGPFVLLGDWRDAEE